VSFLGDGSSFAFYIAPSRRVFTLLSFFGWIVCENLYDIFDRDKTAATVICAGCSQRIIADFGFDLL
jgi:hypothetical protein